MGKTIRLKYPSGEYHTALVNRFVVINNGDRDVMTIWYNDITELKSSVEKVGSFTLIDEKDGVYTHLYCNNDYEKIYQELKECIINKHYKQLSLDLLPYSIDDAIDYNYFNNEESNDGISVIKKEITNQVLSYISKDNLEIAKSKINNLVYRLNGIKLSVSDDVFNVIVDSILKEVSSKKLDLNDGYIDISSYKLFMDELNYLVDSIYKESNDKSNVEVKDEDKIDGFKITFENEYVLYKFDSCLDLGDLLSLSFVNANMDFMGKDLNNYKFSTMECKSKEMFTELLVNDRVFINSNTKIPVDGLYGALNGKFTLITKYKIFDGESL